MAEQVTNCLSESCVGEEISTINAALEALGRIERAEEHLRLCVIELKDRDLAVLGTQLDSLLGEIRIQLEGRLEGCEDNLPGDPGDNGPYGRII